MRFQLGTFWSEGRCYTKQSKATTLPIQEGDGSLLFPWSSQQLLQQCLTREAESAFIAAVTLENHHPEPQHNTLNCWYVESIRSCSANIKVGSWTMSFSTLQFTGHTYCAFGLSLACYKARLDTHLERVKSSLLALRLPAEPLCEIIHQNDLCLVAFLTWTKGFFLREGSHDPTTSKQVHFIS